MKRYREELPIGPVCASKIYRHCAGHQHYWERGYHIRSMESSNCAERFNRKYREQWYYSTGKTELSGTYLTGTLESSGTLLTAP